MQSNQTLARISHKIRRERTEIECWCGLQAEARMKLGRHPVTPVGVIPCNLDVACDVEILGLTPSPRCPNPHQCQYSGAQ